MTKDASNDTPKGDWGTVEPDESDSSPGKAQKDDEAASEVTAQQKVEVERVLAAADFYAVLELSRKCSDNDVKKAYRRLALKLHPDKNNAEGAEEAFKRLSMAFQCLADTQKKSVYDVYGEAEKMPQKQRQQYEKGFVSAEDLFDAFFTPEDEDTQVRGGDNLSACHSIPLVLLFLLTTLWNFMSTGSPEPGRKFSWNQTDFYKNERLTPVLNSTYYVSDDFHKYYMEGSVFHREFEEQVEAQFIKRMEKRCEEQEALIHKRVARAKRRRNATLLDEARRLPRDACMNLSRLKLKHNELYRDVMNIPKHPEL
eukprot:TRINITY_DN8551_c0_g1_i10.p1 TRINITY_DN8551_c0_g1~~TRINITY_DN8551_c0_g1_i10.p1  ORF type:complete len:312 (-),score=104.48 TRINITY_DN8551_c0_g1_i10:720-1655(-)